MTLTPEQAIARVPFLAQAKGVVTTPLAGGITNLNFKIDADGKSYVLRITGANTDRLGIRRDVEHEANLAAGRLGIAPEVLYYIEPEGYLVTRFIKARRLPPEIITLPENILRGCPQAAALSSEGARTEGGIQCVPPRRNAHTGVEGKELQIPVRFRMDHEPNAVG